MKKIFFYIIIINIGFCNALISQPTIFSRVLFDLSNNIQINSLVHTVDNAYMLITNKNHINGTIVKIDSTGYPLWGKEISNTNATSYPNIELNDILKTDDSCFIVSGNIYNQLAERREILCLKINNEGDTIWTTTIGGNDYKKILSSYQTYDKGIILTGYSFIVGAAKNIYIVKLDFNGNVQWTKTIEMGNYQNSGSSIKQLYDSSYLITGFMINNSPYEGYPFLLNLSETGEINWAKKYITDDLRGRGNDFIITDSGFLLYIELSNSISFLQTDFSGNILWNKSYNIFDENSIGDITPKLYPTTDNSILGVVGDEAGGTIFKLDLSCNPLWFKYLFLNAVNVTETHLSEYLIYGNGPLLGVKKTNSIYGEIGFIQIDSLGNGVECTYTENYELIEDSILSESIAYTIISNNYTITNLPIEINDGTLNLREGCVDIIGDVDEEDADNELVIYPNPGDGIFNILLKKQGNLTIFNGYGQLIYQDDIETETTIDLSAQQRGMYYYLFDRDDGNQYSGKLVLTY